MVAKRAKVVEQPPVEEPQTGRAWGSVQLPLAFAPDEVGRTTLVRVVDGRAETEVMPLSPLVLEWLVAHGYRRVVDGGAFTVPLDDLGKLFRRRGGRSTSTRRRRERTAEEKAAAVARLRAGKEAARLRREAQQ